MVGNVADYTGCQLEPWRRPKSVSSGDAASHEGPQVGEDSHPGSGYGGGERAVLAKNPMRVQDRRRQIRNTTPDEGGMVGGRAGSL